MIQIENYFTQHIFWSFSMSFSFIFIWQFFESSLFQNKECTLDRELQIGRQQPSLIDYPNSATFMCDMVIMLGNLKG